MSSYNRVTSPGGRRIANPARTSDSTVDAYSSSSKRGSYASPRSSGERVIPISTETFLNVAPTGRPRRSSLLDQGRGSTTSRTVVDKDYVRSTSPPKTREYYIVPASPREPREARKTEHKKVYSIDGAGATLLSPAESDRYHRHRRRDGDDRGGGGYTDERKGSSALVTRQKEKSIDDDDAFSYTDAAGMFRETQPSWREYHRPRRASLDRGSRDRSSMQLDPYAERRTRDGPPVSTRGWDKVNNVGRTRSVREGPREVYRDTSQDRGDRGRQQRELDDRRGGPDYDSNDEFDYLQREPRRARRQSATGRQDRSVSRRGFGIRVDSPPRRSYSDDDYERESLDRDNGRGDHFERDQRSSSQYNTPRRHDRSAPEDERQRDERRRDDDRDDVGKLVAGGVGAAALYGIAKAANNNNNNNSNRGEDRRDYQIRHRSDQDEEDERNLRDGDRRDRRRSEDEPEDRGPQRRHDLAHSNAPYPEDDRGLGFVFEGPSSKLPTHRDERPRDERSDNIDRIERVHEDAPVPTVPSAPDPDEEYRRRFQQAQQDLGRNVPTTVDDEDRERRRRERENRLLHRHDRDATSGGAEHSPRDSIDNNVPESSVASSRPSELRRRPSIIDQPLPPDTQAQIIDNSLSEKRENRVRIVDPPTEEEDRRPRGILKKPTAKFPENPNEMREGVAPLKDSTKKGIPPGARWTKIDRRLVNPEALEEAKERYEERLDCVIVLRVLTKEEIQKLADRTKDLRDKRFEAQRRSGHRHDRERDRRERDEYSDDGLEDWERDEKKPIRMLEAPPMAPAVEMDRRSDHRDREGSYVSSRTGRD